jgi:hypothetical protein
VTSSIDKDYPLVVLMAGMNAHRSIERWKGNGPCSICRNYMDAIAHKRYYDRQDEMTWKNGSG